MTNTINENSLNDLLNKAIEHITADEVGQISLDLKFDSLTSSAPNTNAILTNGPIADHGWKINDQPMYSPSIPPYPLGMPAYNPPSAEYGTLVKTQLELQNISVLLQQILNRESAEIKTLTDMILQLTAENAELKNALENVVLSIDILRTEVEALTDIIDPPV